MNRFDNNNPFGDNNQFSNNNGFNSVSEPFAFSGQSGENNGFSEYGNPSFQQSPMSFQGTGQTQFNGNFGEQFQNMPDNQLSQPFPPYTQGYPYGMPANQSGRRTTRKSKRLRVALWCCSAFLIVMAVSIIIIVMQSEKKESFVFTFDDPIPYNSSVESSYATDIQLSDAPNASADINGPQISAQETLSDDTLNIVNFAYRKVSPSIVCITSYQAGTDYALTKSGEGSGIIITDNGYIATNSHVVDDSKSTGVMITLSNGNQYLGTVIGIDKKTDLAVIKIDANDLLKAEFANSDSLYVGQEAYAIGNPGGSQFSNSLTKGTVSAVNRVLSSGYVKYIQTDAAINPGNSGGALVNENGQVIGMNTAKLVGTDYEGMGFAIPSNKVIEIINKLIKYGYVNDRGTLGVEGTTCSLYESKMNNVPQGMVITKIKPESPLYNTSAKEKDIITAINGTEVKTFSEFADQLSVFRPGDEVTLTLFRVAASASSRAYTFNVNVVLIEDSGE